ncbi:MAG: hypothetical protein ACOCRK_02650, partial [bacterium]
QTTKPTKDFLSTSGYYSIDKEAPILNDLNVSSKEWTNEPYNIVFDLSDNLSGIYPDDSYIKLKELTNNITETKRPSGVNYSYNTLINNDGIYEIDIYLEDVAKNIFNKTTYGEYRFDNTKPIVAEFSEDTREYIDDDLSVDVTIGDNLSGIIETKYVVNNSPTDHTGAASASLSTSEGIEERKTFSVNINEPGSWWIHVYQRDRAGNERWTVSDEYRIVRLINPTNKTNGSYSHIDDTFFISPDYEIERGTRFDLVLKAYGINGLDAQYVNANITAPKWVLDDVDRKVDGEYKTSSGDTIIKMNYYSHYEDGSQDFADATTNVKWWAAFVPPFGTPLTINEKKQRVSSKTTLEAQLELTNYVPSKTHIATISFDITPESSVHTQIIENEY